MGGVKKIDGFLTRLWEIGLRPKSCKLHHADRAWSPAVLANPTVGAQTQMRPSDSAGIPYGSATFSYRVSLGNVLEQGSAAATNSMVEI